MAVRILIQSRLSSTRMPAKALLSLAGRPVAVLAAQRAGNSGLPVVIATSDQPEDDAIAAAATANGVEVFRGSLHDPLMRFHRATSDLTDDDVVVRLTADNVVPDGPFVEALIARMRDEGQEYVRVAAATPYGLGAEAFTVRILREAYESSSDAYDHEHVTPWIRRHTDDLEFMPPLRSEAVKRLRCTIDTLRDYTVAEAAMRDVADPVGASWLDLLDAWVAEGGMRPAALPGTHPNPIAQGPWVLGAVQLGVPYGAANTTGVPDLAEAARMLDAAAVLGVTHVDTARAYGESEARIGQSLAHGLSERIGVVTKVRPLDEIPNDGEPAWARMAVQQSVEASLRRLQSSRVSALLLHRYADWVRGSGGVREAMLELREQGVTELVGVSLSTPRELKLALDDPEIGYVQMPFNALDRRWLAPDVQAALRARTDVIVTVRSVFLQGLLVAGSAGRWPANADCDPREVTRAIDQLVAELGRSSAADLCVAYARGHVWVTSVVLGADTRWQVQEQSELMNETPLSAAQIERVHEVLPSGSDELVDPSRWYHA